MGINIGFDADGVLFDTESFQLNPKSVSYMKKKFGLNVKNANGYGIKDIFSCSSEVEMKFWTHFVLSYSLFFRARLWMKEVITELRKNGNRIYIITSKACALEKNYRGIVVRFLFELGLKINGIHVDGIEYCSLSNSAQDKLKMCQQRNICIMVEDKKENIEVLSKSLFVLCFDTRNNQGLNNENVIRVRDSNEVFINIQKIVGIITNSSNIFTKNMLKSKGEKSQMDVIERKSYNEWLRECYSLLPINRNRIERAEKRMQLFSKIYAPFFEKKYHPVIKGIENAFSQNGSIFVCNHLCNKDMLFLFSVLFPRGIAWHPLIKKEILGEKTGIIFYYAYSVFVDRTNNSSRHIATQELAKLLINGYNILIFPEGTYNKTERALKDFTGVSHVYLSQVLQRPIINCALTKDYEKGPQLRIDKPYVVPEDMSIDDAVQDSFTRLLALVEQNL